MLRKTFVVFRNFIFRNYREEVLGNIISGKISKLKIIKKKKRIKNQKYYKRYWPFVNSSKIQFISILK